MRIIFGFDDPLLQRGQQVPVAWSEADAVNGHMLLAGKSGSGKTFSLRRIVRQITRAQRNVRVHLMDVHGDLELDDCSTVIFSESTPYGINPLKLSSNPHYGGVRKRIQAFIEMVNDSSRTPMGDRQVASLRNLLQDLYAMHGFRADDASTWHEEPGDVPPGEGRIYLDIPFESKDSAKDAARAAGLTLQFDRDARCWWTDRHEGPLERYPCKRFGKHYQSLAEAAAFAKTRLRTLTTGGGTKSTRLLEEHNKRVVSWQAKARKFAAGLGNGEDVEEVRQEVARGVDDVIESFSEYVAGIATGKELDALVRYDSLDTVRSIVNRLETIVWIVRIEDASYAEILEFLVRIEPDSHRAGSRAQMFAEVHPFCVWDALWQQDGARIETLGGHPGARRERLGDLDERDGPARTESDHLLSADDVFELPGYASAGMIET